MSAAPVPSTLDELLGAAGLYVTARAMSETASTHAAELVTCRTGAGALHTLYCKRGAGAGPESYGHRGGVPYEALVYEHLLAAVPEATAPRFFGAAADPATGETILLIEHLSAVERLHTAADPGAMARAARWLGAFHAACSPPPAFLRRHDASYFQGWAERARSFVREPSRYPWLDGAVEGFAAWAWRLAEGADTVIHGEFYPKNVLVADGSVHPVDWESAAAGPGTIDLASLVQGWPPETAAECTEAYVEARWGGEAPAGFGEMLEAAHLHLLLRWLGDRPSWTNLDDSACRFAEVRAAAQRLGVL
jgi:hypothetical protein